MKLASHGTRTMATKKIASTQIANRRTDLGSGGRRPGAGRSNGELIG
jgi:hypothetical protein